MKYLYILLLLPIFLSSCSSISETLSQLGSVGLTIFFAILMLAMLGMFFYAARKRKQADKTAVGFSHQVRAMVDRIDGAENKIKALEIMLGRIESDKKYAKDTAWRDKLLSKVIQEMGAVYYTDNQHDKVIEMCSAVIELEPGHMMSYYNRGTLYGNLGMYEKAIKDLTDAINIDSGYANIYNNRGMIYHKIGDFQKAITDYGYALQLETSPITYYNRGNAYAELKKKEEAMADYESALKIGSISPQVRKQVEIAMSIFENEKE